MDMSTILERLQDNRPSDESLFILFDGALFPAMKHIYEYEASPQACPIYYGTRHETSLEVSPCLYEPKSESNVWEHSKSWRDKGVIFTSSYSFLEVLKHLQSLISVSLFSGQLAYWRFYSPDWLASVMDVLEDEELMAFTGPVSQWAAFTQDSWQLYRPHVAEHPIHNKDEGWLHLSDEHIEAWRSIKRESFIQRTVTKANETLEGLPSGMALKDTISNLFDIAKEAGFKKAAELERFIFLSLNHPDAMSSLECQAVIGSIDQLPMSRLDRVESMILLARDKERV